jgi:drug/metabolite transporter (DMT)-like permease
VPRGRGWPLIVLFGGLQAAVAFVSLSALRWIPAATLSFLFYTYPAWIALVAAVRRTEPLTRPRLIALGLSLLGIVLMVGSPWAEAAPWQGVALALGSAMLYALYVITIGRFQRGIPPAAASAWISVGAGVLFLAAALVAGTFTVDIEPLGWLAIGALGLFSTAIGFVGFLRGLEVLGTVRTAIISTVEPFWTAILGALVLSQALTLTTLAGGALIGIAVVVLQLGARHGR